MRNIKLIIASTLVLLSVFTFCLSASAVEVTPQGMTCCDDMQIKSIYIRNYSVLVDTHYYYCEDHGTVEYCRVYDYYKVYEKRCTNCGANWGEYEKFDRTRHTNCQ